MFSGNDSGLQIEIPSVELLASGKGDRWWPKNSMGASMKSHGTGYLISRQTNPG
jgi:hypothetical protein